MSFLAPLFAIGLVGLAIPILVHLVHRERKETTLFPSLMFLLRTPYQHSRRQRIRDWRLFLTRAMVFLLLVAAFARPVFDRAPEAAAAAGGGREVVILLDRSFSMRVGDRWSRAQRAARQALDALGPSDRGTVVLFSGQAQAVREENATRTILRAAVDSAAPGDAATRYAPALILARRILSGSGLPRREVVVISDFQRSGWDVGEDARLPAGTTVTPVDVAASADVTDRAVRAVELRRSMAEGRERIAVTARISNTGPAARGIEARLEVAGRLVATNRVDLGADAGGVVTFEALAVPESPQQAAIRITPDNVPADDVLHFVLERAPSIPVLVVEGIAPGTEREVYLQRALEIGDRPSFDITTRRGSRFTAADLAGKRLVVMNNAAWPSGDMGRRLHDFVNTGGGMLVVAGDAVTSTSWAGRANGLLPVAPGDVRDRLADKGAVLGMIDRSHPALSLFGSAQSGDLSAARFYRYRHFAADSGVIARFDDGAVAVFEQRTGTGRSIVIASSFDGLWNDLPRQPVFLPFVHQLAQYAAGYRAGRSVYEVGDPVDLQGVGPVVTDSAAARRGLAYIAVSPRGNRLRIGGTQGDPALIPAEAGIYEVRPAGAPGVRPRLVAVNIPGRELDLSRFDPTRLTHTVSATVDSASGGSSPAEADLAQRERKQSVWWYLLLMAATLLVVESVLAHRLSRNRVTPVS